MKPRGVIPFGRLHISARPAPDLYRPEEKERPRKGKATGHGEVDPCRQGTATWETPKVNSAED